MAMPNISLIEEELRQSAELKLKISRDAKLSETLLEVCNNALSTLMNGGKILLAGNGGSAADAQHLATELVGRYKHNRKPLSAIALTTDTSLLTALSNDFGFETIFSRQLEAIGKPGDFLILLSTSGNSKNIINAATTARNIGIKSVAFCGASGTLRDMCDYSLSIPSSDTPKIQECHIMIGHIFCEFLEQALLM